MSTQDDLLSYLPSKDLLNDRVIIVTGASDGIGKEIAQAYAQCGATVVLIGKTIKKLEQTYDAIIDAGSPEPAIYPMDFTGANELDYENMASTIFEQLGSIDGLLLNAGWLPSFTPIKHYESATWAKAITANLHAHFLMSKACLPYLEQSSHASIIFSSHAGQKAYNGAFGVAKAGGDALLKILADEYDDQPFIRVNGIDTGPINTFMRRRAYPAENPDTVAAPKAIIGPYLYYMGSDSGKETGNITRFDRIPSDFIWPGAQ